jgi:hypothetical protein
VTGFDETVPPDDDPARDENSAPEHDVAVPAVHDEPEPDEVGGARQQKPDEELAQDDELRSGQWGPPGD